MRARSLGAIAGLILLTSVSTGAGVVAQNPGGDAVPRPVTNAAGRVDVPSFDAALEAVRELPRLRSLLVSWRGDLVLERYFGGARATQVANIKSAAKSVLSALVGIAIDRNLIKTVDQPIAAFFPDVLAGDANRTKRTITIQDLLTMRSGLESTSNRNYGAWVRSQNWVRYALTRPMLVPPGTEMDYSTGNSHLLSAIVTRASGLSTWQFAERHLARPLGFSLSRWPTDPQGIYFGGNDMLMTPRQMVAFGELYLRGGQVNGQRVLSEDWIRASTVPRGSSRFSGQYYGYGWWIRPLGGFESFHAWGFGGQFVFVVPALDLVVVSTSSTTVADDRRTHRRAIDDVIERAIVPVIAEAQQARVTR